MGKPAITQADLDRDVHLGRNPGWLMQSISAVDGRDWTVEDAQMFTAALKPMTLRTALKCVGEWYSTGHTFSRIMPGDINDIDRKRRNDAKPSEAQISRECEQLGITGEDAAWAYRRRRMLGDSPEKAQQALTVGTPQPRIAASSKPIQPQHGGSRLGGMSLNAIIGSQTVENNPTHTGVPDSGENRSETRLNSVQGQPGGVR